MRIRRDRTPDADYDSVLDTMTNVVGILVIVVTVTQLNVGSAMGRAKAALIAKGEAVDHPPVSEADIAVAQHRSESTQGALRSMEERWARLAAKHEEDERTWGELKRRLGELTKFPASETVRSSLRELRRQRKALEAEIDRLENEIRRTSRAIQALKQQLEALRGEKPNVAPPLRMRIPFPDARRSEGKDRVNFLVRGGRVYACDVSGLFARCIQDLKAAPEISALSRLPERQRCEGLANFWSRRHYTDGTITLRFQALQTGLLSWDVIYTVGLKPGASGASLESLRRPASAFAKRLTKMNRRKDWLYFWVYDDSFEAYLTARNLAEEKDFAAGWAPFGSDQKLRFAVFGTGTAAEPD